MHRTDLHVLGGLLRAPTDTSNALRTPGPRGRQGQGSRPPLSAATRFSRRWRNACCGPRRPRRRPTNGRFFGALRGSSCWRWCCLALTLKRQSTSGVERAMIHPITYGPAEQYILVRFFGIGAGKTAAVYPVIELNFSASLYPVLYGWTVQWNILLSITRGCTCCCKFVGKYYFTYKLDHGYAAKKLRCSMQKLF